MKEFTEKDKRAVIILDSLINLSYNQKREILSKVKTPSQLLESGEFLHRQEMPNNANISVITYLEEQYPQEFLHLQNYPLCLYCLGKVELLTRGNNLAIVGSRKTLSVALQFASNLAKSACKDYTILTGNTMGVEMEVLKATKGENTVCFLAGGIENEVRSNPSFYSDFLTRGLLVSNYCPSMQTRGYQYIERNELLAKLCQKLVVVSGSESSGVRYTAEYAEKFGKQIYALPYTVGEVSGKLNNALIKRGATILYQIEDLVCQEKKSVRLNPLEEQIVQLIKEGLNTADKIIQRGNFAISEVFTTLVSLEIKDIITKCGADEYALTEF